MNWSRDSDWGPYLTVPPDLRYHITRNSTVLESLHCNEIRLSPGRTYLTAKNIQERVYRVRKHAYQVSCSFYEFGSSKATSVMTNILYFIEQPETGQQHHYTSFTSSS